MGIPFTLPMGFLFTVTMGILLTIGLGIQLTISRSEGRRRPPSSDPGPEPSGDESARTTSCGCEPSIDGRSGHNDPEDNRS